MTRDLLLHTPSSKNHRSWVLVFPFVLTLSFNDRSRTYNNVFTRNFLKAIANCEKHGVSFEEAATVFSNPNKLDWDDTAHSQQGQRFKRLGLSVSNRLLLVVYTREERT